MNVNKKKVDDIWNKLKNKNKVIEKPEPTHKELDKDNNIDIQIATEIDKVIKNEDEINIEEIVLKALNKAKEMKSKVEVETVYYAGQKYE